MVVIIVEVELTAAVSSVGQCFLLQQDSSVNNVSCMVLYFINCGQVPATRT